MRPEEFIKKHPFPKNGVEINNKLVRAIQDPDQSKYRQKNLEKLLQNNARLVYIIFKQYNYDKELAEIMSIVYEGLDQATQRYDFNVGMPFYHYAVQTTRGILQNNYNYTHDLIHVPVMKKKKLNKKTNKEEGIRLEYSDINDYLEHQYIENDEKESLSSEANMLIREYEKGDLTEQSRDELKILKLSRENTLKDLAYKTKINTVKLRKIIDKTTEKLKKFNFVLQQKLSKNDNT